MMLGDSPSYTLWYAFDECDEHTVLRIWEPLETESADGAVSGFRFLINLHAPTRKLAQRLLREYLASLGVYRFKNVHTYDGGQIKVEVPLTVVHEITHELGAA